MRIRLGGAKLVFEGPVVTVRVPGSAQVSAKPCSTVGLKQQVRRVVDSVRPYFYIECKLENN